MPGGDRTCTLVAVLTLAREIIGTTTSNIILVILSQVRRYGVVHPKKLRLRYLDKWA
jgi:hypothetical protein